MKKIYVPPMNPLAKTEPVRPYITRKGKMVKGTIRKPKYRKRIA